MKELVAIGLSSCAVLLAMHTTPRTDDWERRIDRGLRTFADSPIAAPVRIVVSTRTGTLDAVERRLTKAGATDLRAIASDQLTMRVRTSLLKTVAQDVDVTRLRLDGTSRSASTSPAEIPGGTLVGTQVLLPSSHVNN